MPIDLVLGINYAGQVFRQWQDAPAGTLLAFAGRCVLLHHGQGAEETNNPRIVLRADTQLGPALVSISPDVGIMFAATKQNAIMLGDRIWALGPALDVSEQFELAVRSIAPAPAPIQKQQGTVVYDPVSGNWFCVIDHPDYANKGVVLRGEGVGSVQDLPIEGCVLLGQICIISKRTNWAAAEAHYAAN